MNECWWIVPGRTSLLRDVADLTIPAWMAACARGACLSTDRQSAAVHLHVPGGEPLLVKWRHTLPKRRLKTFGRPSRERREGLAAQRARRRGIQGPLPYALAERRQGGRLVASLLVRPFLPHAQPLPDVLRADDMASELAARALAAWHDAGLRHGDAYAKNMLLLRDRETVVPIGYPSASFVDVRVRTLDSARRRDVAQFAWSVEQAGGAARVEVALAAYARAAGFAEAELRRGIAAADARLRAKKAKRAQTRAQREPDGVPQPVALAEDGRACRMRMERL